MQMSVTHQAVAGTSGVVSLKSPSGCGKLKTAMELFLKMNEHAAGPPLRRCRQPNAAPEQKEQKPEEKNNNTLMA